MTDEAMPSLERAKTTFVEAVHAFQDWASRIPVGERSGEWECDYGHWSDIWSSFAAILNEAANQNWDASTTELLLYALARDNEMEVLKQDLIENPEHLLALAKAGLTSPERDARWQIADALGSVGSNGDETERLLEQFFHDQDEYVRRRALLALARRRSKSAGRLAVRAWETGHEYQRMAALEALSAVSSPLLEYYLNLARRGGRQYLIGFADKLHAKRTPKGG